METTNFLIWLIFIAAIGGFALVAMTQAYIGKQSISILFKEPITVLPLNKQTAADVYFQQGCDAYLKGKYSQAIEKFMQAVKLVSSFAEAYHNIGLAFANLRQDNEAVFNLMKASDCYQQSGKPEAIAIIKQNLGALKARKQTSA